MGYLNGLIAICGFIGAWLLFTFPLYQGVLELASQTILFWRHAHENLDRLKPISSWYWLVPPLMLYKQKRWAMRTIQQLDLSEERLHDAVDYLDRATAWYYVALGGLLNAIAVTYGLMGAAHFGWFIASVVIMIALGVVNVRWRVNTKRINKKIKRLQQINQV